VYEGVKAIKPWVKVTGSTVCSQAMKAQFKDTHPYNMLLQDWERWTREGIIDAVVPMNYKTSPQEAALFSEWTAAMVKWAHSRHAYNGLTAGNSDTFIAQIKESREKGTHGVAGFAFNSSRRGGIVDALRGSVYKTWVPTPPMPWKPARTSGGPIITADPKELYNKAASYAGTKDFDTAIILLKRAIEKDINYTDAYLRLGKFYLQKGMKAQAVESFRQTLEIDPNNKEAQAELLKIAG
jgi:tetratricopeptide (TPR) repeat protein